MEEVMTISALIEALEKLKEQHGDIPVFIDEDGCARRLPGPFISTVYVAGPVLFL